MINVIREEGTDYLFAGFLEKALKKRYCEHDITLSIEPRRGEFYFCQDYWITKQDFPVKFMFYALPSHQKEIERIMGKDCALVTYAADPTFHKNRSTKKNFDVGFIGKGYYETRREVLSFLKANYNTCIHEDLPGSLVPDHLSQCKVLVNHTRPEIDVNLRFFESMALGCQLMLRTPSLSRFAEEGVHYLGYSSIEEMKNLIDLLLADHNLRERIAYNARLHFLENHTYAHRAQAIINHMKEYA